MILDTIRPSRLADNVQGAIKSLRGSQFFSLSAGVISSNVLSLLVMPALTRLYTAESFGVFALFLAISTISGTFATLRLEQSLLIIKNENEFTAVTKLSAILALGLSSLIGLVYFLFVPNLPYTNLPAGSGFSALIAISSFCTSMLAIATQLAIKYDAMRSVSIRYLVEKSVLLIASISLFRLEAYGLILSHVLASLASIVILLSYTHPRAWLNSPLQINTMVNLIRKYSDYPLQNGTASVLQILTMHLPPLFFSVVFPMETLGFFNLAQRIIDVPVTVITTTIGMIYYKKILQVDTREIARIYARTMRWLLLIFVLPILLTMPFIKQLVGLIFGQSWEGTSAYLLVLMPAAVSRWLYLVSQTSFLALRRLDLDLRVAMLLLTATLLGLAFGFMIYGTPIGCVATSSALTFAALLYGHWLVSKSIRSPLQRAN